MIKAEFLRRSTQRKSQRSVALQGAEGLELYPLVSGHLGFGASVRGPWPITILQQKRDRLLSFRPDPTPGQIGSGDRRADLLFDGGVRRDSNAMPACVSLLLSEHSATDTIGPGYPTRRFIHT